MLQKAKLWRVIKSKRSCKELVPMQDQQLKMTSSIGQVIFKPLFRWAASRSHHEKSPLLCLTGKKPSKRYRYPCFLRHPCWTGKRRRQGCQCPASPSLLPLAQLGVGSYGNGRRLLLPQRAPKSSTASTRKYGIPTHLPRL